MRVPLSVLDLVPVSSGSSAGEALRRSIDLARETERLGYGRYWVAEHHLNPGVAGTSTAVVLAMLAARTTSTAPQGLPIELPEHRPDFRLLVRGAELASADEIDRNPRAKPVRLRAAERIRRTA